MKVIIVKVDSRNKVKLIRRFGKSNGIKVFDLTNFKCKEELCILTLREKETLPFFFYLKRYELYPFSIASTKKLILAMKLWVRGIECGDIYQCVKGDLVEDEIGNLLKLI